MFPQKHDEPRGLVLKGLKTEFKKNITKKCQNLFFKLKEN